MDKFASHQVELDSPYEDAFSITPDNANDLANTTRAIYIGTTGDLKVDMANDGTVIFKTVPVGLYRLRVKRVYATGTDAAEIIGLL